MSSLRCPPVQKENQKYYNRYPEEDKLYQKSTSTHQHTHQIESQDNLHVFKLESQILQLQKKIDEQEFQIHHLTEQSDFYMQTCEKQKQEINKMNVDTLRCEYQSQVDDLLKDRTKIQEVIAQLNEEYEEAYQKEQKQLDKIRSQNTSISNAINVELKAKGELLELIGQKDEEIRKEEEEARELEERVDGLRHIERKFMIAMKELQRINI